MAERAEQPDAEAPDLVPSNAAGVGAAMATALGRRRAAHRPDPKLDAFLDEQTRLARLQTEHLHEQRQVILLRLRLGAWKDRITLALQALTVLVGLIIAGAIAVMAWQAHEDHGVAIEAFSVPPDFAQRGMTGQVVAGQLLDRLADLQARTVSTRPASTYANDWGDDIKVEIPETGVSIGELNRWLRGWLGSETRITGAVVRTPAGLAVTARAGDVPGRRFEGPEADVDQLIDRAAEGVYAQTQPYRYAVYLASQGRTDQALAAYARLAGDGAATAKDRAWAYFGWATLLFDRNDEQGALEKITEAIRLDPWIDAAYPILQNADSRLGREAAALAAVRAEMKAVASGRMEDLSPEAARVRQDFLRHAILGLFFDDYARGVAASERLSQHIKTEGGGYSFTNREILAQNLIGMHEVSRGVAQFPPDYRNASPSANAAYALDDWRTALEAIERYPASARSLPSVQANQAMLLARLGRLGEAQAVIARTPLDCTPCLDARGEIAARSGDRKGADRWFEEAARPAPLPDFYLDWARALLILGDPDAAIAELKQAHTLGPDYADPLEVWGEALMAKRDDAGAVAKFTEAHKDAPKWGRNHLRWGEALMLSGRYAGARAQFVAASGLDLSAGDRAALNVLLVRTAKGPLHG